MQVVSRSEELLVVEHCPKRIGTILIVLIVCGPAMLFRSVTVEGLVPILFGVFAIDFPLLVIFAVAARRLCIVLDRASGRLVLQERSIFRERRLERPLAALVRVERQTNLAGIPFLPDHGHYHRAILVLAEDRWLHRVPVSSVFLLGPSARRAARAINGWLGRSALDFETPAA